MSTKILMPDSLTAENGAKYLFSCEFTADAKQACPNCWEDDPDPDDCNICDGTGSIDIQVPIGWPTIKDIYAMAVKHLGETTEATSQLDSLRNAVNQYHKALNNREHGGVASHKAVEEIQKILNMSWSGK